MFSSGPGQKHYAFRHCRSWIAHRNRALTGPCYQTLTSCPQSTFQTVGKNFRDQIGFSVEGIQADLNRFSMTAAKYNPCLFADTDTVHDITIRKCC